MTDSRLLSASNWCGQLETALRDLPYGIGKAVRAVQALPEMEDALRDLASGPEINLLPEELVEKVRSALDILDGGDGAIFR